MLSIIAQINYSRCWKQWSRIAIWSPRRLTVANSLLLSIVVFEFSPYSKKGRAVFRFLRVISVVAVIREPCLQHSIRAEPLWVYWRLMRTPIVSAEPHLHQTCILIAHREQSLMRARYFKRFHELQESELGNEWSRWSQSIPSESLYRTDLPGVMSLLGVLLKRLTSLASSFVFSSKGWQRI